eukprot:2053960-Ditylum_brightwellii.AAC.1
MAYAKQSEGRLVQEKVVLKSSNPLILKDTLETAFTKKEYISSSFGSRNTVKLVSRFVIFQGIKNEGNRAIPSPISGLGTSSDMQYCCSYFDPIYQPLAKQLTNTLAISTETAPRALESNIHPVLLNYKVPTDG